MAALPLPTLVSSLLGLAVGFVVGVVSNRQTAPGGEPAPAGGTWRRCRICGQPLPWAVWVPGAEWTRARPPCGHALPVWRGWNLGGLTAAGLGMGWLLGGQPWPLAGFGLLLLAVVWPLALVDLVSLAVELRLVVAGLALRFFGLAVLAPGELPAMIAGMLAGAGLFTMVEVVYEVVRGRVGLGEGDAAVLGLIGAFVGWEGVLVVVAFSALAGLVGGGGWVLWKRGPAATPIPYVPFLALAGLVVFLLQTVAGGTGWQMLPRWLPLLGG